MEDFAKIFGNKLSKVMKDKNVSANSLAAAIGIDRASFSKYFKGQSAPRIDTFLAICKELNIEPNYFFKIDHKDYTSDSSKTDERKIIESIFCLCNIGIIKKVPSEFQITTHFGDPRYALDIFNKGDTLYYIMEECLRYAGSEFVKDEEICKKIADKFESELIEENKSHN